MSSSDASAATTDELAAAVRELRESVDTLRTQNTPGLPPTDAPTSDPHAWLSVLEAPRSRRLTVPRVVLEVLFLAGCAAAAAIADLDALSIAALMAGAWALVALVEVVSSRVDRERERILYATPPVPVQVEAALPGADPAWYSPPAEQTMLDLAEVDATAVTRLPPVVDELESTRVEQADVTIEQRPAHP